MDRQAASPAVVPNIICVPQLFDSITPGTQLEILLIIIPGIQTVATSNGRAAAAAVLGLKCPGISYDQQHSGLSRPHSYEHVST